MVHRSRTAGFASTILSGNVPPRSTISPSGLRLPSLDPFDALVETLLVFGTVGYPKEARAIAGFQIAIDFMLLAVFLAHFVGRLGEVR